MNNPISQIERTKDAYAGNIQGLQKRANVSKELIDLLAMQQLKKDLDAAKRNQMMQMQGNPATVKDQLQQGLMGEYRQQAAKEMGMMPSEGQAIARAQQAMPQGMPQQQARMPQGMPQGTPQGAPQQPQGVMSQARPVQLAGGGIVAFSKAGSVQVPEGLDSDELADFLRGTLKGKGLSAMEGAKEFKRLMAEQGFDFLGRPIIEEKPVSKGTTRRRARAAEEPEQGGLASNFDNSALQAQVDAEYDRQGIVNPKYAPPPNVAQQEEERETRRSEAQQRAEQRKKEEYESSLQGQLDAVKTSGIMSGVTPYKLGQEQRTQAEAELALDPDKKGLAAIERIRGLSKMSDNEQLLKDMQDRVQATYDETALSGMDRFQELLNAAAIGGTRGVGIRGSQLRQAERNRRRQLDQDIRGIQNTTIELNRSFGADAARAYAEAEANVITQKQNARDFLRNAEQAEVASVMDKARLTMEEQRNVRQLFSEQERNRLLAEQITATNARALGGDIATALAKLVTSRAEIAESVRLSSRYAELDSLDPTDSDDARKIELLEGQLASEVAALAADIDDMADNLRARQRKLDQAQQAQTERLTPSEQVAFSAESQDAIARAGG